MSGVDKEATSYQCPDCGQPRTGEECGGCAMVGRLLREHKGEHGATRCALCCFSLLIGFQKARAEQEVDRLRGAIEKHRENENQQRGTHPLAHLDRDIELWAVLKGRKG